MESSTSPHGPLRKELVYNSLACSTVFEHLLQYQEQPDIEKEVKRLFRQDNEAIDVKWEVVIEDSEVQDPEHPEKHVLAQGTLAPHGTPKLSGKKLAADTSGGSLDMLEIGDIFGDVSDSEDDEKDINVMDSGEEEMLSQQGGLDNSSSFMGMQGTDSMMSADGDIGELS